MRKKVIVAGHICLDITPMFPEKQAKVLGDILSPGKLIRTGAVDVHTGGAVANTGLAMRFMGADVVLMGKIGKDAFGSIVLDILKEHGADGGMVVSEKESTSYSVVLAVPGIDRIFLHNPGANDTFLASDIPDSIARETALFHFGYPPLMKSMYKNDGEELVRVMRRMKEMGAATSLDMAAVDADSEAGRADWKKILERVLPYVDFFVPSAEELCYMLGRERFQAWEERANGCDITEILDVENDIIPLADQCMELGAKILLIKCGASGMYYRTAEKEDLMKVGKRVELDPAEWSSREGFERSYLPEKILSGTGAGDASIAAFLTAMLEGYSIERTMQLAAAAGASCVEAYDALSGLKPLKELEEKIEAGWEKCAVR